MSTPNSLGGFRVIEQSGPVSGMVTFTVADSLGSFVVRYDANGIVDVIDNTYGNEPGEMSSLMVQAAIADHLCRVMFGQFAS